MGFFQFLSALICTISIISLAEAKPTEVAQTSDPMDIVRCNFSSDFETILDVSKVTCPLRCAIRAIENQKIVELYGDVQGTHMDGKNGFYIFNAPASGVRTAVGKAKLELRPTDSNRFLMTFQIMDQGALISVTGALTTDQNTSVGLEFSETSEAGAKIKFQCWQR